MDAALFAGCERIGGGPSWTLYRERDLVLVVRFHGEIDDDASAAWRACAAAHVEARGWPRVGLVAPTDGHATSSLASRMKTVAFLRMSASHFERVVILSDANASFVIKTMLRAAGVANVSLVDVASVDDVWAELTQAI